MSAPYKNRLNRQTSYQIEASRRNRNHSRTSSRVRTRAYSTLSAVLCRGIFAAVVIAALFVVLSGPVSRLFFSGTAIVQADQNLGDIQYKVVEIQTGDSLWTIAKENMGPGYSDVYDYIREIKACNQLKTNNITAGSYLVIPFYETEALDYASAE